MHGHVTQARLEGLRGHPVSDRDGRRIGHLEEVYYGNRSQQPEWVGISMGFLGTKLVLAPVHGSSATGDGLAVAYSRELVDAAPELYEDDLDRELQRELIAYYRLPRRASDRSGAAGIPGVRRRAYEAAHALADA